MIRKGTSELVNGVRQSHLLRGLFLGYAANEFSQNLTGV